MTLWVNSNENDPLVFFVVLKGAVYMKNDEFNFLTFEEKLESILQSVKDGNLEPIEYTCNNSVSSNSKNVIQTVSFKYIKDYTPKSELD